MGDFPDPWILPVCARPVSVKSPSIALAAVKESVDFLLGTTSQLGSKWVRGAKVSTLSAIYDQSNYLYCSKLGSGYIWIAYK